MAEPQPSKLVMRVRFSSPAPSPKPLAAAPIAVRGTIRTSGSSGIPCPQRAPNRCPTPRGDQDPCAALWHRRHLHRPQARHPYTSNDEVRQEFSIVYRAEYMAGEPTVSDETLEVRWVPIDELADLPMDRSQRDRLRWAIDHDRTWSTVAAVTTSSRSSSATRRTAEAAFFPTARQCNWRSASSGPSSSSIPATIATPAQYDPIPRCCCDHSSLARRAVTVPGKVVAAVQGPLSGHASWAGVTGTSWARTSNPVLNARSWNVLLSGPFLGTGNANCFAGHGGILGDVE
jgi:hypothetical protein